MTSTAAPRARLEQIVDHLAHLLPAQGPIGVFIHHNTLHAFQHLPFDRAVMDAARVFDAEPYLREEAYREALTRGRIHRDDLDAVIAAEGRDLEIRRAMLDPGARRFAPATIHWTLREERCRTEWRRDLPDRSRRRLEGDRPSDLFDFWLSATPLRSRTPTWAVRPHDGLRETDGIHLDDVVHPLLIGLTSAFLDQGLAYWPMPDRDRGLWCAAASLLAERRALSSAALQDLPLWARRWAGLDSAGAVLAALTAMGVEEPCWASLLQAEMLALRGWAGLVRQFERAPSLAPHEAVPASLMDFLAVRLLLTVAVLSTRRALHGWRVPVGMSSDREAERLVEAATLFDAAQLTGTGTRELSTWPDRRREEFRCAVLAFDDWERRRLWHAAYERRHERQVLLPLREHPRPSQICDRVAAQVFFCLDEREESIRRHLEEVDPQIETFGAVGYFGVAMSYTGVGETRGAALCPVMVTPQHRVVERPAAGHERRHATRQAVLRFRTAVTSQARASSRTLIRGWIGTFGLGVFSLLPLAARLLGPRLWGRCTGWLHDRLLPEARTELQFMRDTSASHDATKGLLNGFTEQEKVERVASVLAPAGLRKGLARLVLVLGHGSTSLNNPHESAYDCGACGGRRGGPNARIFAAMANRPGVRRALRAQGIHIPEDTWFVGGYHDTASDDIVFYDLEALPATHAGDLARARRSLDEARVRNARERSRRFEHAQRGTHPRAGLYHVQARAEHLAEPRPEYGHCTNAVCIVGRRSTTRGLFLDRRAFLVSYDPLQDRDNAQLGRILSAAMPVCAGISLEYYFSCVDNERYGCGTKLPHNVTGLVGVMNGCAGDLRTGLAAQMVEIHEPVRLLCVIETTPARITAVLQSNPPLRELVENRWLRLATMDPHDGCDIQVYRGNGRWEPIVGSDEPLAVATSSLAWCAGRRTHLGIARIAPAESRGRRAS